MMNEDNIIEIGGVKYSRIEMEKPKGADKSRKGLLSMMMPLMLTYAPYMMGNYGIEPAYSRRRPDVNIVKEYELIQQKKSKLSRNDRDWVVRVFHDNYKKVDT